METPVGQTSDSGSGRGFSRDAVGAVGVSIVPQEQMQKGTGGTAGHASIRDPAGTREGQISTMMLRALELIASSFC